MSLIGCSPRMLNLLLWTNCLYECLPLVDYIGPVSVEENSNFTITCRASPFSYIKWRLNDSIYDFGVNNPDETKSDRFLSSTMFVPSAKRTHTGKYKCSREADDFGHNLTVVLIGEENTILFSRSSRLL